MNSPRPIDIPHECLRRDRFCKCFTQWRGELMRVFTFLVLGAVAGIGFTVATQNAQAQAGVAIGVAPDCPYGYYDTAPYGCAPTGYYGPEWFNGDAFVGAGPWFHGAADFQGSVNNRLHPDNGYPSGQWI